MFLSLGGRRIRYLTGDCLLSPPPGIAVSDDSLDIGVIRLSGADLPPYPDIDKKALPISAIGGDLQNSDEALFQIVGFPGSRSRRSGSNQITLQPYSYTNIAAPLSTYPKVNADPALHLALTFNQKKAIGKDGGVRAFPFPYGMSGSPVWLLADHLPQVPAVGIATRWNKNHRCIVATNCRELRKMILAFGNRVPGN